MARVDLQCVCGHMFFVGSAQISPKGDVECPACGDPVRPAAPAKPGAKPPTAKLIAKAATKVSFPEAASDASRPEGGWSRKKLVLIGGGAAVVVIGILLSAMWTSGPKVDYEKQAALAVEQRKKAFEEAVSKPGPESRTPATTALPVPLKPVTPPPVKPAVRPDAPVGKATPVPVAAVPSPGPKPVGGNTPVNPDLSARLRTEVLPLHPFYQNLVFGPGEKARLEGLLSAGTTGSDDVDFLQGILNGGRLKAVRDEIGLIAQTIPILGRESREGLPVDKVVLDDGRILNCRIIDEGVDIVRVSRTVSGGVGGQLPLRRDTITRLEKGKGIGSDYLTRWEAAQKGTVAAQVEVLSWCKENGLLGPAKLAAYTILKSDPSNPQARAEASFPDDPVKNAEAVAKGAVIPYQGKSWAPKDLRDKLVRDGYVLIDGQWYAKRERSISVPGLFRYEKQTEKPVTIMAGGLLCHDTETKYRMVQDPGTNTFTETADVRYLRRFYAPPMRLEATQVIPPGVSIPQSNYEQEIRVDTDKGNPVAGVPMRGEVPIWVLIGEAVLEASVMTMAEIKPGGSITIYLVKGSGENEKRTKLYQCDAKEAQTHPIPADLIRGATEINLVAVIEATAAYTQKVERRHVKDSLRSGKSVQAPALDVIHIRLVPEYKAMLFPSTATGSADVFHLKAVTGEPAAALNKLFASNLDALK